MAKLVLSDVSNFQTSSAVTAVNANSAATETSLENTLSRDGMTPNNMNAQLDMNSYRIINLGIPVSVSDAARLKDVQAMVGLNTQTVALANGAYVFNTKADAQAATIPAPITSFRILGYTSPGDLGEGIYLKVGSEPAHDGKIQSADTAWWELQSDGMVRPQQFGAKGDGVTNDAPAIRSAAIYLISKGGGKVYLPGGNVYLLSTAAPLGGGFFSELHMDNLYYEGDGDTSELKVVDGYNTGAQQFTVFFPSTELVAQRVDNFKVRNLKFNLNGTNNDGFNYNNSAVHVAHGEHVVVDNNYFVNCPGNQVISLGTNADPPTVTNYQVTNNRFENAGPVVNSTCSDHSTIYCVGDGIVSGNKFKNSVLIQNIVNCAMEIHGNNTVVTGNSINRYRRGFNLAATVTNLEDVTITGNSIYNSYEGIVWFSSSGFNFKGNNVTGNDLHQFEDSLGLPFLNLSTSSSSGGDNILIANNILRSTATVGLANAGSAIAIGPQVNISILGNMITGFSGRGIECGTIVSGATSPIISLNKVVDCGKTSTSANKGGIILNSLSTFDTLLIQGNEIRNTGTVHMTTGIGGNAPVNLGRLTIDNLVRNVTTARNYTGAGMVTE